METILVIVSLILMIELAFLTKLYAIVADLENTINTLIVSNHRRLAVESLQQNKKVKELKKTVTKAKKSK